MNIENIINRDVHHYDTKMSYLHALMTFPFLKVFVILLVLALIGTYIALKIGSKSKNEIGGTSIAIFMVASFVVVICAFIFAFFKMNEGAEEYAVYKGTVRITDIETMHMNKDGYAKVYYYDDTNERTVMLKIDKNSMDDVKKGMILKMDSEPRKEVSSDRQDRTVFKANDFNTYTDKEYKAEFSDSDNEQYSDADDSEDNSADVLMMMQK